MYPSSRNAAPRPTASPRCRTRHVAVVAANRGLGNLGRVPKTLILEAVTEGKGTAAADNIAKLKKDEMADRAAGLLTGTGWLPPMLRAA